MCFLIFVKIKIGGKVSNIHHPVFPKRWFILVFILHTELAAAVVCGANTERGPNAIKLTDRELITWTLANLEAWIEGSTSFPLAVSSTQSSQF